MLNQLGWWLMMKKSENWGKRRRKNTNQNISFLTTVGLHTWMWYRHMLCSRQTIVNTMYILHRNGWIHNIYLTTMSWTMALSIMCHNWCNWPFLFKQSIAKFWLLLTSRDGLIGLLGCVSPWKLLDEIAHCYFTSIGCTWIVKKFVFIVSEVFSLSHVHYQSNANCPWHL
jgi:hypothetical protein